MNKLIILLHLWAKPRSSYIFFCTQILFLWIRSRAWEDCEDVHDVEHLLLEGETGTELPRCWHSWQGELGGDDKIICVCWIWRSLYLVVAFFYSFFRAHFTPIARPLSYVTCFYSMIRWSKEKFFLFWEFEKVERTITVWTGIIHAYSPQSNDQQSEVLQ